MPNFAAGGIATPADAALMMQLGAEAVFVGSGIFKSGEPARMAAAIVRATTHFKEPAVLAEVSRNFAMAGLTSATAAAWVPVIVAASLALTVLLYKEDG